MKNLFSVIPEDFFKPLTSKYRREYSDCILLIFNTFKSEISYGVDRDTIVNTLIDYFETDEVEMSFDEETTYVSDARGQANGVIATLKNCGWLEYEQDTNHQLNVVLYEYTIPIIESMNKVIKEEETEYQGIISQIYSSLQNQELYQKPYELILKGVQENTEHLISELKKLSVSIKRHMEKQTNEMDASQVLDLFFEYHETIGSKAYLRMKTSENISYFRSSIIEKLNEFSESQQIMDLAVKGYMELEQVEDEHEAYDCLIALIHEVKSSFYRLDDIIVEIDRKNTRYQRSAVMRAKFLLSTGNNMEGKISQILNDYAQEDREEDLSELFTLYPQTYLSPESLKTIPVTKKLGTVDDLRSEMGMSEEERALHKEALREKNRRRFSRKNIDAYVMTLLAEQDQISVTNIPVQNKRDLIRIIYIRLYGTHHANGYKIERKEGRVKINGYEFPDFMIVKR